MNKVKQWLSYWFTPVESNNFKAKAIHLDFLTYYLVFAFLLTMLVKNYRMQLTNVLGLATDITVEKLVQLTNDQRRQHNLKTLTYNDQLSEAARLKAQDMFTRNYWSHYAPDGKTPWDFIITAHYQYEYAGENLAKNFLFSQGVIDAWMNSPTHRENILRPEYEEFGFAIVNGVLNGEETTLVVQMFGKPLLIAKTIPTSPPPPLLFNPLPVEAKSNLPAQPVVLAKQTKPQTSLSQTRFSFDLTLMIFGALLIIFVLDLYLASRLQIIKIGGKHLAHIIFLGFIIVGLILFVTQGNIPSHAAFNKPL